MDNLDEQFSEIATREIAEDNAVKSAWNKAFIEARGNAEKTKSLYVIYRAQQLRAEHDAMEQKRQAELKADTRRPDKADIFLVVIGSAICVIVVALFLYGLYLAAKNIPKLPTDEPGAEISAAR
ncbi:MAG: hypothetical protein WC592_00185 [Candidatus Omnitrophota bacterium]|nr:hypothetical protein [Candidatus Omnitrophota bacterium]